MFTRAIPLAVSAILATLGPDLYAEPAPLFEPARTIVSREAEIGDLLPAVILTTQEGKILSSKDLEGKAVALTFIYSRCSTAALCPMVSRNFDVTQSLLSKLHLQNSCHLLSISLDPEHDTTETLATYSRGFEADPALWTFANVSPGDLHSLSVAVGLEVKRRGDQIDHNLRTVVIDPQGKIQRIFRGDSWTPQELVAELKNAARHTLRSN